MTATQTAAGTARDALAGLIPVSIVTGFLGMNLFDFPGMPLPLQFVLFIGIGVLVSSVLFYTLSKSKPLADFLDAVSDDRLSAERGLSEPAPGLQVPAARGDRAIPPAGAAREGRI